MGFPMSNEVLRELERAQYFNSISVSINNIKDISNLSGTQFYSLVKFHTKDGRQCHRLYLRPQNVDIQIRNGCGIYWISEFSFVFNMNPITISCQHGNHQKRAAGNDVFCHF